MRYLSVCSGIEAASCAWHPLGWEPVAFSEIEKFPSAVLAHHYPNVPNWGDMTKFKEWPDADVDVLVGGTPCQSFSVAGLRKGLADPRGNLALTYLAIADKYRPEWLVWENVPGVLSSGGGRDFGSFLGGLGELGYGWAYRVLDAQYFGLAQRRKRVFVVGCLGGWQRAAAVLFDSASLRGDSAPRREAGQKPAPTLGAGPVGGGRTYGTDSDSADSLVVNALTERPERGGGNSEGQRLIAEAPPISLCLNAGAMGRIDAESETLIPTGGFFDVAACEIADSLTVGANQTTGFCGDVVAHSLRADGFDASEDGRGRGTPLVPIAFAQNTRDEVRLQGGDGQIAGTLASEPGMKQTTYISFRVNDHGADATEDQSPTLRRQGVQAGMAVRRLTPRECERLQGFPDDYTLTPYRGKPAADGPRYKALGNSMAVPVMHWIGQRIAQVQAMP